MNRKAFYEALRRDKRVFGFKLSQPQVDVCEAILDECEVRGADLGQTAYILATAYGETGGKMQPRRENLSYSAKRLREVWPHRFRTMEEAKRFARKPRDLANRVYNGRMGNRVSSDDGWLYRGNGLGQITGRDNHQKWGDRLGVDLIGNPEALSDLRLSVRALVQPMLEGWATGVSLPQCVEGDRRDYKAARRVWNGTFEAGKYADFALSFEAALEAAEWGTRPPALPDAVATPPKVAGLWPALVSFILSILGRFK
ncbi:hypothetical protein BV394_01910 [Brevirhabdus pacifica]|uniref:Uncharacterized protein n=1 Tax=Brevirhabdus pacifica TaxID=1267768 RepID=A0A1U7DF98_9RHOB|nr:hypothetical protein [Brevirhabdus pacifica]APX88636.1 hypothetical protein BV394_01910 [Brevirhabdus pacifica]PJJ86864.1 putative chitinase [Brevirhabdus pacifica]